MFTVYECDQLISEAIETMDNSNDVVVKAIQTREVERLTMIRELVSKVNSLELEVDRLRDKLTARLSSRSSN